MLPPLLSIPFTAFVMAAAASQYSRVRLAVVSGATRMIRSTVVGVLALRFGERIRWSKQPIVQGFLIGLIVLCTVGSAVSIYQWIGTRGHPLTPAGVSKITIVRYPPNRHQRCRRS